jgi:hypothetical protein
MQRVQVDDDLALRVGRSRAALTPSQAFAVAEALIRGATRAIVLDAADAAMVRGVMADPVAYLRDARNA